jgi:hypothetical protein
MTEEKLKQLEEEYNRAEMEISKQWKELENNTK